jgi:hypothetical protein
VGVGAAGEGGDGVELEERRGGDAPLGARVGDDTEAVGDACHGVGTASGDVAAAELEGPAVLADLGAEPRLGPSRLAEDLADQLPRRGGVDELVVGDGR